MKQAVMLTIYTSHQPTIDAIVARIPASGDARVWADEYAPATVTFYPAAFGLPDRTVLSAAFRCHSETDQSEISTAIIQAVMNNVGNVEKGSNVRLHKCYHDETPPRGCEESILYAVDEQTGHLEAWVDRVAGRVNHFDPLTNVTTQVALASEGLSAAQIKLRMADMNLRLR